MLRRKYNKFVSMIIIKMLIKGGYDIYIQCLIIIYESMITIHTI